MVGRQTPSVRTVCLLAGVAVALWSAIGIPVRATYGERVTADEPQYLLSALSLWHDHDLWIDDEIAAGDYRPFHEVDLPVQTEPRADGRSVSPHDPLLPVALAVPMGLGGWAAAKATLAVLAGGLAALLTWTAHRRLGVPLAVAAATAVAFGASAPLVAYAVQVYPELPAALAVAAALAVLLPAPARPARVGPAAPAGPAGAAPAAPTGAALAEPAGHARAGPPGALAPTAGPPGPRPAADPPDAAPWAAREVAVLVAAVATLPWLGVKYAPVAVVLAVLGALRLGRERRVRAALAAGAALAVLGVVYLVVHRLVYGGWTVYAAGDHFAGGELTVSGLDPDRVARTRRLAGLLLDRGFGLVVWMPGFLLAVPALAVLVRRRPGVAVVLGAPLAAGWATATWVALTMHGWWWPGRQVVVVVPCLVLAVAWWAARAPAVRVAVAAAGALGAATWAWLVVEVLTGRRRLIVDFERTTNPLVRLLRLTLPDYRDPTLADWTLQALWLAALAAAAGVAVRRSSPPGPDERPP